MIIFSFIVIIYLALAVRHYDKKQNKKRNFYIEEHRKHIRNNTMYRDYLKWCEKNCDIPMDKQIYLKEVENRNSKIKNLMK